MTPLAIITAYVLVLIALVLIVERNSRNARPRTSHKSRTDPRFLIADGVAQQVFSPLHEASTAR